MTKEKVAYCKMCQKNRLFVKTDKQDYVCGMCRFTLNKSEIKGEK